MLGKRLSFGIWIDGINPRMVSREPSRQKRVFKLKHARHIWYSRVQDKQINTLYKFFFFLQNDIIIGGLSAMMLKLVNTWGNVCSVRGEALDHLEVFWWRSITLCFLSGIEIKRRIFWGIFLRLKRRHVSMIVSTHYIHSHRSLSGSSMSALFSTGN